MKKQKDKGKKPGNEKKKDEQRDLKEEPIHNGGAGDIVAENSHSPLAVHNEDKSTAEGAGNHGEPPDAVETQALHTAPSEKTHNRQPSLSLQSQLRSSTFRRTSVSQTPLSPPPYEIKSPTLPVLSPEGESINDIYRKQTLRLDELEKENKRLVKEVRDVRLRWEKAEQELEDLRESNGEFAELKMRATKVDAQNEELIRLVHTFICSIPT